MKKREANFGVLFRHWLKANYTNFLNGAFELKQTTTDSIPFDAVKEHQIDALLSAQSIGGIIYKAPDDSMGVKPFDYFYLSGASSFVVIKYPKHFSLINIDVFLIERQKSTRKSLTAERAKQIARINVLI